MIEKIEIKQKWFVGQRVERKIYGEGYNCYIGSFISERILQKGYDRLNDIPEELLKNSILFEGYTLELVSKPIYITKSSNIHPVKKIRNHFFLTKREAQKFIEQIKVEMMNHYWDDKEELNRLREFGYDLEEDECFAETSINEDGRWHEFLEMWYDRGFNGLGYTIFYDDEKNEF